MTRISEIVTKQPEFDLKPKQKDYPKVELPQGFLWKNSIGLAIPLDEKEVRLIISPILITPKLAEYWLDNYTKEGVLELLEQDQGTRFDDDIIGDLLTYYKQRNLSETNLGYIMSEQQTNWRITGDVLRFSCKPIALLDFKHRLTSIVKTGLPMFAIGVIGLDHSVFDVLDTGKARNAADILSASGFINSTTLAGAARFILNYERKDYAHLGKSKGRLYSNSEILSFCRQNPALEEHISYCISVVNQAPQAVMTPRVYGALSWIFMTAGYELDFIHTFFMRVYDGLHLEEHDSMYWLRNILLDARANKDSKLKGKVEVGLIIQAFNRFTRGKKVGNNDLNYRFDDSFPIVLKPKKQV